MGVVVDVGDAGCVEGEVRGVFRGLFGGVDDGWVGRVFGWVLDFFEGRDPGYEGVDVGYHDVVHTLQGTLCLVRLLEGGVRCGGLRGVSCEVFELGVTAILFHDLGYLRERGDGEGSGAKFTLSHVGRGVGLAGRFLGGVGFDGGRVEAVQKMIWCTDMGVSPEGLGFGCEGLRVVGLAVGTADLLGQLAASDYPERLPLLFDEFAEAARFLGGWPEGLGPFRDALDLMSRTREYFEGCVMPRLEGDLGGVYRFLADPFPDGRNVYLDAIEGNLCRVDGIVAAGRGGCGG